MSKANFTDELKELAADSIDFGVLISPGNMLVKRTKHSTPYGSVRMVLNLGRREIDIRFPSTFSNTIREYKFIIPIDQVFDLSQFQARDETKTSFILTLRTPPHFYKKLVAGIVSTHDEAALVWREEDSWIRQTNVLQHASEVDQIRSRPITIKNYPEGIVNIGRWTTYRITIDDRSIDKEKYRVFRAALKDYNVPIVKVEDFRISHDGDPAWDLLETSLSEHDSHSALSAAHTAFEHSLQSLLTSKKNDVYLPFSVRYQLEVCISNGWINEHNLTREFLETLSEMENDRAKYLLETVAMNATKVYDPMKIFKIRVRRLPSMKSKIPDNCVLIRSVTITPSSMVLSTPYVEMTNRVVRRYKEHSDRFLRVRFEDDEVRGFARINATSQKTMDEVLNKVFRTLSSGIVIGDRRYEFLAFGNSQLREHGAYFFASLPTSPRAYHIRAWMGRFEHERIVAKHAARIGQCFSTTRAIKNVGFPPVRKTDLIADVERNSFNFTDGVGKISRFYAETIARELGIRGASPSVYQFRIAGCKGVLAIAPDIGATNLQIRKSQFKFETTYSGMEIIRCSEYWVATLNRQLILVLSALGVPDEVFLLIQEKEIRLLERAMELDSAALEALTGHVDPNRMTLTIASLVQAGFRRSEEPFVNSLLGLWRAWSIKYLKEKARLPVRDGACILGCTDETGTLRGHFDANQVNDDDDVEAKVAKLPEVFVQITSPETGHRKVIDGLCVIARNPSLHAGDMRVVKAIDVPALHHLVDVLVLPQTGDRDISSMCSGGDLDGDDYVVIWDERLLPKIWNAEPMDYSPPPPIPLDRDVTQTDITKFFVKYMKNDFLPKIALSHLAWADFLDEGIRHEKCLDLARLHSKAVDYPKSGQPAQMPKSLNAKQWPHFMEKKGRSSYKSHKALGQLYDAVDRVAFVANYDAPFDERILNACEPVPAIIQDARELKHEYDSSLQRIMAQHDIRTEFEVWSTFVLDHSKASKDYKFHEEIGQLSKSLKEQYHAAVIERAGGKDWSQLVPWAVAMYRVTKEELEAAKREGRRSSMPFLSFPWILQSTLIQIVKGVDNLAGHRHDQIIGEWLENVHQPSYNPKTCIYDDPLQVETNGIEHVMVNDPRSEELPEGKSKAFGSEPTTAEANAGVGPATTAHSEAYHMKNEDAPSEPPTPVLRISPLSTADPLALNERVIDDPCSPDALRMNGNTSPPRASEQPIMNTSKAVAIEDHTADLAENKLMNLSWPAIQPHASNPASLKVSEENSSRSFKLWAAGHDLSAAESGAGSGLLIDVPEAQDQAREKGDNHSLPITVPKHLTSTLNLSSLAQELASLSLENPPPPTFVSNKAIAGASTRHTQLRNHHSLMDDDPEAAVADKGEGGDGDGDEDDDGEILLDPLASGDNEMGRLICLAGL